jgi:hypothetical protein
MKTFVFLMVALPLALNFINSELTAWIPWWCEWLLRRTAARIPDPELREQLLKEWIGELSAKPGALWRVKFALPIALWGRQQIVADAGPSRFGLLSFKNRFGLLSFKNLHAAIRRDFWPVLVPAVTLSSLVAVVSALLLKAPFSWGWAEFDTIITDQRYRAAVDIGVLCELILLPVLQRHHRNVSKSKSEPAQRHES